MKISRYSDIHNECSRERWTPPAVDLANVVILAGDIGSHTHGIEWAAEVFPAHAANGRLIYVTGNHEYYDAHLGMVKEMRKKATETGVRFLEQGVIEADGVRILGCTLWSGFSLYGGGTAMADAMNTARRHINDYILINTFGGKLLHPRDTAAIHQKSASWLDQELSKPFDGKTVVVTHFAPHRGCIAAKYAGDSLTAYFVTDLSWLMKKHQIAVWCYGHTHGNVDFEAENGCRVISNQRGYPNELAETGFRPELVLEV